MEELEEFIRLVLKRHKNTKQHIEANLVQGSYDRDLLSNHDPDTAYDIGLDHGEYYLALDIRNRFFK